MTGQTQKRQRSKNKEKTKSRLQVSTKNIENSNLYDVWTMSTHDAYSNAMRMSSILLWNHKIDLSIEFI